jgi:hypothetical protein
MAAVRRDVDHICVSRAFMPIFQALVLEKAFAGLGGTKATNGRKVQAGAPPTKEMSWVFSISPVPSIAR